LRSDFDAFAQR
jgi:hypothetical protein